MKGSRAIEASLRFGQQMQSLSADPRWQAARQKLLAEVEVVKKRMLLEELTADQYREHRAYARALLAIANVSEVSSARIEEGIRRLKALRDQEKQLQDIGLQPSDAEAADVHTFLQSLQER